MGNTDLKAFEQAEKLDEAQIQLEFEGGLDASCVHTIQGQKQLSYRGIKTLALKMSQAGQPLIILEDKVELTKYDEEDKTQWHWQSYVKMKNNNSGYETIGASEQPFLASNGSYDNFGRNKAFSKAERNAIRKQLPEAEIEALINSTQSKKPTGDEPPTQKQIDYIKALGHTGIIPASKQGANLLIEKLKGEKK